MNEVDNKILKHCKECAEDRKKERHDLIYPKVQEITSNLDERIDNFKDESIEVHHKLGNTLDLTIQAMQNLEKVVNNGFKSVNDRLDKYEEKFATKQELKETNIKVDKIDSILYGIGKWVVFGLFGAVVSLIVYIYLNNLGK